MRHLYPVGANVWLEAELVAPQEMRAGDGADVTLVLRSASSSVEGVDVGVHGLAGAHLGLPAGRVVLRPGVRRSLTVRLQLPTSVTPGRHQLVLELRRQLDPDDTQLVPFEVDVLPAPVPVLALRRSTLRRRGKVRVENPSDEDIRVALTGSVNGAAFRFRPTVLDLPAGATRSARLRVVSRSRFGRRPATVSAATANASGSASATVVGRSRVGPFVAALAGVAALAVAAVATFDEPAEDPSLQTAAADGGADAPAAEDAAGTVAATDAGSTPDPGAGLVPGQETPGSGETAGTVPGAAPIGAPTVSGGGSGPVGDCTTPDGGPGWALRGRVLVDGISSVSARPAGFAADFATATTTDEGGFFMICPLELGDYLVTALSEGYYPLVLPARLAGVSSDLGEIQLRPGAASMIGTVHGPSGPLAGASVVVRRSGREVGRAVSDDRGEYLVLGVPAPADVVVEVSAPGLAPASFGAEIRTDGRIRQPDTALAAAPS